MTAAIIGNGSVGSALAKCYKKHKIPVILKDKDSKILKNITFLNICFPYTPGFIFQVIKYVKSIKPQYVIIHSTVEYGTAEKIQKKCNIPIVSSPVRGSHDNLYKGLIGFLKYIGCKDINAAVKIQKHFKSIGIKSKILPSTSTVELAKLLCTSYFGICIKWHDMAFRICKKTGINYHDIIDWNNSYNEGYSKLGQKYYVRPILQPPKGKIGGTCIVPNARLLKALYSHTILDTILE